MQDINSSVIIEKSDIADDKYNSTIDINKEKYNSYFDKTISQHYKHKIKMLLLGILTLGIAYPWIICSEEKAKCNHTVICGKRLKFIGKPKELVYCWILWWFLIIITLGIYGIAVKIRMERWKVANTIFDDTEIK